MTQVESIKALCIKTGIRLRPLLQEFGISKSHLYRFKDGKNSQKETIEKVNKIEGYLKKIERLLLNETNVPLFSS